MSILDLPIPPRPAYFGADGAPPGVSLRLDAFGSWADSRPTIRPRVGVVHTNAASVESTTDSQIRWGNAAPNNTKPHYCINAPNPAKVLRSDLRAIANSTGADIERLYGERDASFWSLAIETADTGYKADPGISDFLTASRYGTVPVPHAELIARIVAYESIVHGIPTVIPAIWNATGWVTHTWPFPYPHFTTAAGKTCPGDRKKATFREQIMPRAARLFAAWTEPTPEEPDMAPRYFKTSANSPTLWYTTDGITAVHVTPPQWDALGNPQPEVLTPAEAAKFAYLQSIQHDIAIG